MISKKVEKALNKQINAELYSAYLYYAMASHLEGRGLKGMANWMDVQVKEELSHVERFRGYLLERGGDIALLPIDAPKCTWKTVLGLFNETCKHEAKVTQLVNNLVQLSITEKDFATQNFLQWFVNEQVEEEASVKDVADNIRLAGDHSGALLMLDREMQQRKFVAPTATA